MISLLWQSVDFFKEVMLMMLMSYAGNSQVVDSSGNPVINCPSSKQQTLVPNFDTLIQPAMDVLSAPACLQSF